MLYYPACDSRSLHYDQVCLYMSIMVIFNVMEHFSLNRIFLLSVDRWSDGRSNEQNLSNLKYYYSLSF
jgi:hypothetical protein